MLLGIINDISVSIEQSFGLCTSAGWLFYVLLKSLPFFQFNCTLEFTNVLAERFIEERHHQFYAAFPRLLGWNRRNLEHYRIWIHFREIDIHYSANRMVFQLKIDFLFKVMYAKTNILPCWIVWRKWTDLLNWILRLRFLHSIQLQIRLKRLNRFPH